MFGVLWMAAIVVFLLLESATYQFICIWFAGGALGALIAGGLGATLNMQILVFFVVSTVLLILTRPFVKKIMANRSIKTNVESVPGKIGRVIQTIDNSAETGRVKLNGMDWTARSADGSVIETDSDVEVVEVSGVKLIVKQFVAEKKGE